MRRGGIASTTLHACVRLQCIARSSRTGGAQLNSLAIVHSYGRDELLRRLAHPFWLQSFGAIRPASPPARLARSSVG